MDKVLLKIESSQTDEEGHTETIEILTEATYHEKNGVIYVAYEESEATGLEGTTTMLEIHKNRLVLVRSGFMTSIQNYTPGKTETFSIKLPMGVMDVNTKTHLIEHDISSGQGRAVLEYDLEFGDMNAFYHKLIFTLKPMEDA